jgi:hypothetical protein
MTRALQSLFAELTLTLSRLIDIFHTICMWVAVWTILIDDYGNVLAVLVIPWTIAVRIQLFVVGKMILTERTSSCPCCLLQVVHNELFNKNYSTFL